MLHALALVKIKDGSAEHFFKSFFQVALVHGNFSAKLFDGDRFTDMLDQHFPGLVDLFPVCFIGQELAIDHIHIFFADHAIHAMEK